MPTVDSLFNVSDSLVYVNDSLLLPNDSVFATDIDSLAYIQQKVHSTTLQISTGFEGMALPSFPSSEDWVFSAILFYFFLLSFSFLRSSSWFYESFRTFFQVKNRSSIFVKTNINDFQSQLTLIFFSLGVLTLYVHTILLNPLYGYELTDYLYLLSVAVLIFGVKFLLVELVGYVFVSKATFSLARQSYFNLLIYWGIIQFSILVFQLYSPATFAHYFSYIGLLFIVLAFFFMSIRLFQIFYDRFVVSIYILLYLCTLEIVPFFLAYWLFRMIVLDV